MIKKGEKLAVEGKYQDALDCYEKALEIDPLNAQAWCHKGDALSLLSHDEEALSSYNKAIETDSKHFNFGAVLGKRSQLFILGRYEEALSYCNKIISFSESLGTNIYYDELHFKGFILHLLKRYEEAVLCYRKSLESGRAYESLLKALDKARHGVELDKDEDYEAMLYGRLSQRKWSDI